MSKIKLEPIDLVCLLGTLNPEFQGTVIEDIVNNQTVFNAKSLDLFRKIYPKNNLIFVKGNRLESIKIPSFLLDKKAQTDILNTLRTHVDNITRTRKALLQKYDSFITKIKKMNYTVVIDCANVGRYNQGTKSHGELNLSQIELMVTQMIKYNQKVLLCLNENHFKKVNPSYHKSIQFLRKNTQIVETPRGLDDDLFWLYASVCKPEVLLVTNDELRNHIPSINGSFTLWKEYRRITYDITKTKLQLNFPVSYEVKPFYIRNTQKLYIPETAEKWNEFTIS